MKPGRADGLKPPVSNSSPCKLFLIAVSARTCKMSAQTHIHQLCPEVEPYNSITYGSHIFGTPRALYRFVFELMGVRHDCLCDDGIDRSSRVPLPLRRNCEIARDAPSRPQKNSQELPPRRSNAALYIPNTAAQLPFPTARRTKVANCQAIPHHGFSSNRITSFYKPRGILNAQAGECCSAKRKTGSPDARNGRGRHHLHGGRRISSAKRITAGRLAHADGHDPPGEAHR